MRREREGGLLRMGSFQHTAQVTNPDGHRIIKSRGFFVCLCLLFLLMGVTYFIVLVQGYCHYVQPFLYFEGE